MRRVNREERLVRRKTGEGWPQAATGTQTSPEGRVDSLGVMTVLQGQERSGRVNLWL
jgi:hypothetical protein